MKTTTISLLVALAASAQAFDFKLTWDNPPPNQLVDVFTTNTTSWASITGFNVYRATNPANFALLTSQAYVTNIVTLTNQPPAMAFYYITFTGPFGESLPSNTNQVFPPMPPPLVTGVKGSR